MVLLRKVIGDALRARRLSQHRTLRDVSTAANVSLGYLSEIERGHKEASSELLGAVCDALGAQLSDMLTDVATAVALAEQIEGLSARPPCRHGRRPPRCRPSPRASRPSSRRSSRRRWPHSPGRSTEVTEGDVTVRIHSDGPLRTTLTTTRTGPSPGQRHSEPVFVN